MRHPGSFLLGMSLALLLGGALRAQDESEKINSNVGAAISLPLNPTSNSVKTSWGLTGGAGYNISEHHSVIGEFMWSALYPSDSALQPIRVASNDHSIAGHGNLYAITGNYRFQFQHKRLGAYLIGGGGWYYRTIGLSKSVTSGSNVPCDPAWLWWGFTCSSGMVTPNQTPGGYDSTVLGGNAGVGFTVKVGEPSYRFYIEPRYHYAPTKNVTTQLLEVTLGIRY